jgi:hypothetical protein
MSNLNCWETGEDEISEIQALAEEVTDEFGGHPVLSDGDGFPDPSTICQRLFDKVRSISLNPYKRPMSRNGLYGYTVEPFGSICGVMSHCRVSVMNLYLSAASLATWARRTRSSIARSYEPLFNLALFKHYHRELQKIDYFAKRNKISSYIILQSLSLKRFSRCSGLQFSSAPHLPLHLSS